MTQPIIDKELLIKWYTEEELTDEEIASRLNIDRTTVVHARKKLNLKSRNLLIFERNLEKVLMHLTQKYKVEINGTNDLIINNKKVKVFLSNFTENGISKFRLTEKPNSGLIENDNYLVLKNGWYRPIWKNKTDILLFVQLINNDKMNFWMFYSEELDEFKLQTLSLKAAEGLKYSSFMNRWSIFD